MTKHYNKLVRDKIPEVIKATGAKAKIRILGQVEYKQELIKKLAEEVAEFLEDPSLDERADIEEVIRALDQVMGFNARTVEQARLDKATKRGEFKDRIFLESVEEAN